MKTLFFGLALPLLAAAQIASVDVTAPTAGYRFDPESHSLRSIEGVPGAASLGEPLALGVSLQEVTIAPSQRLAFGVAAEPGKLVRLDLHGATAAVSATEIGAGRIFFSPASQSMAVLAADRLEVWTGLGGEEQRLASFDVGEGVDAIAVSDDGSAVAVLRRGVLSHLTADGLQELASGARDMAFLSRTHDLLVLSADKLSLVPKLDRERQEDLLAATGATRLLLSGDGSKVALVAGDKVLIAAARGGDTVTVDTGGDVARVSTSDGAALFQITLADGRLFLLDVGDGPPALSLVDGLSEGGVQ